MIKTKRLPDVALPKFALTKEQERAFLIFVKNSTLPLESDIIFLADEHGSFSRTYKPLNDVPLEYLLRALITREYHVEETFEDWLEGQKNRVVDGTPASCAYQIVLEEYKKRKEKGEF